MEGTNNFIPREVHEEFAHRMEDANARQDARLKELESKVAEIHALTVAVEKLAVSIQQMAKEQEQQGKRLETIENRDGEMWRKILSSFATGVVGALVGFIAARFAL